MLGNNKRAMALPLILLLGTIASVVVIDYVSPTTFIGPKAAIQAAVQESPVLRDVANIPSATADFIEGLTQNPFEEKTVAPVETSTKTAEAAGMKVVNDPADRTGILSTNPRSKEDYTIVVGVKNPTNEFIAKNSRLGIYNVSEVEERTGLTFNPFLWDDGKAITTIEPKSYLSASATSTKPAKEVKTKDDIGPTNIFLKVVYAYEFKPVTKLNIDGKQENALIMYHAKFIVSLPGASCRAAKAKDDYRIKEEAAGGPVAITRLALEPYLEPGKNFNLNFKIKNADPNSGIDEIIAFQDKNLILLIVPLELTKTSDKITCNKIKFDGADYQSCTLTKDFVKVSDLKDEAALEAASNVLADNVGNNEMEISAAFKVNDADKMDIDKVYNVYLVFKEDAYTYYAIMAKGMAVQPG